MHQTFPKDHINAEIPSACRQLLLPKSVKCMSDFNVCEWNKIPATTVATFKCRLKSHFLNSHWSLTDTTCLCPTRHCPCFWREISSI